MWRIGSAVAGPVAFGCGLCTARRTGMAVRVVRLLTRPARPGDTALHENGSTRADIEVLLNAAGQVLAELCGAGQDVLAPHVVADCVCLPAGRAQPPGHHVRSGMSAGSAGDQQVLRSIPDSSPVTNARAGACGPTR